MKKTDKTKLKKPDKTRRMIITSTALLALSGVMPVLAASRCISTPSQPEGPFYPLQWPEQHRQDLTFSGKASGESIVIQGQVMNNDCTPVANALVELWQANTHGRYRHVRDNKNNAQIDPNFYGLGRIKTNKKGEYEFKTIMPGSYAAGPGWQRPPHLHFKVLVNNKKRIVTQMYFVDNPLNNSDLLLAQLSSTVQERVIIPLRKTKAESKGVFNLYISNPE